MDKVAMYKEEIYKTAQTKWKTYLESAKGVDGEVSKRVGELLRNSRGYLGPKISKDIDRSELYDKVRDATKNNIVNNDTKKWIHGAFKPAEETKGLRSVNHEELDDRKFDVMQANLRKKRAIRRAKLKGYMKEDYAKEKPLNVYDGPDGEDYININHGGTESRIKAFLRGGNSSYKTTDHIFTGDTSKGGKNLYSDMGVMTHSNLQHRARRYAEDSASSMIDNTAVLTGKIKKKYIHNLHGSDEYIIPQNHYNKIEEAKVHTPKNNPKAWESGDFYKYTDKEK